MTTVNSICPQGLTYTVASTTRMCSRSYGGPYGCSSHNFPTHGLPFTKVCGRARGYQQPVSPAFYNYQLGQNTIERPYVSGLSVTYGSPRNHIWTFAVGNSKDNSNPCCSCPCAAPNPDGEVPPFVGENYFCESGNNGVYVDNWFLDDPLWDSQGCASGSAC